MAIGDGLGTIPTIRPIPSSFPTRQKPFKSAVAAQSKDRRQRTELQALQIALAAQFAKDQDKGFLDTVKGGLSSFGSGVKGVVFGGLDYASRPGRFVVGALAGGDVSRREGGGFLDQLKAGFDQGVRNFKRQDEILFADYLNGRGILTGHGKTRAVVGFAGDVLTDPLTYVGGIGVATRLGTKGIGSAERLLDAAEVRKLSTDSGNKLLKEDPEQAAKFLAEGGLTKSDLDRGFGSSIEHSLRAGQDQLTGRAGGYAAQAQRAAALQTKALRQTGAETLDDAKSLLVEAGRVDEVAKLERWTDAAFQGYQRNVDKLAQLSIALPFASKNLNFYRAVRNGRLILNPTTIAGRRVAPKVPSLERAAAGESLLANLGPIGRFEQSVALSVGKKLSPGFQRAADHALAMSAHHTRNLVTHRVIQRMTSIMGGAARAASRKEQDRAVRAYEGEGMVTQHKELDEIRLNEKKLDSLNLNAREKAFVRAWHEAVEEIRKADEAAGIKFDWDKAPSAAKAGGKGGRGYVPHVYTRAGHKVSTIRAALAKGDAWWEKTRDLDVSLSKYDELVAQGKVKGFAGRSLETNPMNLLAIRARGSANKRVDRVIERDIADSFGVPMHLPDTDKVAALLREAAELEAKMGDAADSFGPQARKRQIDDMLERKRDRLEHAIGAERAEHERRIKWHDRQHGRKRNAGAARASMTRAHNKRMNELIQRLRDLENRNFESVDLRKGFDDILKQEKKNARAFGEMQRRFNKIQKEELPAAKAANPNKAAVDEFNTAMPTLVNSEGIAVAIPRQMKELFERHKRMTVSQASGVEDMSRFYNRMLSKWKVLVTAINPGYRVRNTMTDFWNAYISGMPIRAMMVHGPAAMNDMMGAWMHAARLTGQTGTRRYKLMEKAGIKPDPKAAALYDEAARLGVMSGLFDGDIAQTARKFALTENISIRLNPKSALPTNHDQFRPFAAWADAALRFNAGAENWGRFMHYRWRRKQGESAESAARMVRTAHFDYEDLTDFERNWAKKVLPFYTWTRKNIPYQIRQIFVHPGRVATFQKAAESSTRLAEDEDDFTGVALAPKWMNDRFAFRVPGGSPGVARFVAPQLGIQDLEKLDNPGEGLKEMLTPFAKAPAEVILGRSFLTDAPIEGTHPRNPVQLDIGGVPTGGVLEPLFNAVGKIPGIPDANIGQTQRRVGDEQVSGPGINPWWSWAFSQVPMTNFFFNQRADIRQAQQKMDHASAISYLGGLRFADVEQDTEAMFRRMEFQEQARRHIRGLRDEDLLDEPNITESDLNKEIERIIREGAGG